MSVRSAKQWIGVVPAADRYSRGRCRDQGGRDAVVVQVADQVLGVVELERKTQHRGDGCQRYIAFLPVEAHADDLLPLPFALADHAAIDQGRRVGSGLWRCQGKTGDFTSLGEARQVALLLFLAAVVQQKLGRAEGVGDADGRCRGGVAARQLLHNGGVGECRELKAAIFLRDDHGEKFVLDHEIPDRRRQVRQFMGNLPIVEHPAEFLAGTVDEGLLLCR